MVPRRPQGFLNRGGINQFHPLEGLACPWAGGIQTALELHRLASHKAGQVDAASACGFCPEVRPLGPNGSRRLNPRYYTLVSLLVLEWDQLAINEHNRAGLVEAAGWLLVSVTVLPIRAAMDKLLQDALEDIAAAPQTPLGLESINPIQQFCTQL